MPLPRYAIYYTPPPSSPLARFGAGVLGYDSFERVSVSRLTLDRIAPSLLAMATLDVRRYGFHARLVEPFVLSDYSEGEIVAMLDSFSRAHAPVPVGPLQVVAIGPVVALVPAQMDPGIGAFARACLTAFDRYRVPLAAGKPEQSLAVGPAVGERDPLDRAGWADCGRFRMALTGPLPASEVELFTRLLSNAFVPMSDDRVEIDAVSLMRQDDLADCFFVLARRRLTGR